MKSRNLREGWAQEKLGTMWTGMKRPCLVWGQDEMRGMMGRGLELSRDKDRNRKPVGQKFLLANPIGKVSEFSFKQTMKLHTQHVKNFICIFKPQNSDYVSVQT